MTRNQIDYWKLQESKRSNLVGEQETQRHNRATESVQERTLGESVRHNVATEGETNRHNLQTEAQSANDLLEKSRSNRAQEEIARQRNAISQGQLLEQQRSNRANEAIGRSNATSNLINANTNKTYRTGELALNTSDVLTRQETQKEQARHNEATEAIQWAQTSANTATDVLGTLGSFFGRVLGRRR